MRSMNTPGSNARNPYYAASQAGTYRSGSMGGTMTAYQPGGARGAVQSPLYGSSGGGGNSSAAVANIAAQGGQGGYSGGGGSSFGGPGGDVWADYQRQADAANAANTARGNRIDQRYTDLHGRTMGSLAGGNSQAVADINARAATEQGGLNQNLTSRGLTGSTIAPTLSSGIDRNRQMDVNRENFNYAEQQRQADANLTNRQSDFIERQSDVGPDMNQMLALAQQYGNGGMGQGGGGQPMVNFGGGGGFGGGALGFPGLAALGSSYGMPSFGGFAHNTAGTTQRQAANTNRAYRNNGAMSGGNFNSGYSNLGNSGISSVMDGPSYFTQSNQQPFFNTQTGIPW